MNLLLFIRSLIETNKIIARLYDIIGGNILYKMFLSGQIKKRMHNYQTTRSMKFLLELSSICNAKCVFCPYNKMTRPKQIMPSVIFQKIINRIKDEKINPLEFSLYHTGEPFLDKNIFDRIKILKTEFPNAKIEITTNFGIADDNIIENILKSDIDSLNISLNSANPVSYKNIMGINYNQTISNIERFLKLRKKINKDFYVQLSFVICEENKNEIYQFWKMWHNKVNGLRFQRPAEWFGDICGKKSSVKKCLYPCNELFIRPGILSNGDFAICCQDAEGRVNKNIMETPILEAFYSDKYVELRNLHLNSDIKNINSCKKCFAVNSNGANWLFKG